MNLIVVSNRVSSLSDKSAAADDFFATLKQEGHDAIPGMGMGSAGYNFYKSTPDPTYTPNDNAKKAELSPHDVQAFIDIVSDVAPWPTHTQNSTTKLREVLPKLKEELELHYK